jgi:hypothetical protein
LECVEGSVLVKRDAIHKEADVAIVEVTMVYVSGRYAAASVDDGVIFGVGALLNGCTKEGDILVK